MTAWLLTAALLAEVGTFDGVDAYDVVWAAVAVAAIATAVGILHRRVWRPGCERMRKFDAMYDLLAGYGPVYDPATGAELRALVPPLAMRMAAVEQRQDSLDSAVATLASVAEKMAAHEAWQTEHVADVERVHAEMWDAINNHTHDD